MHKKLEVHSPRCTECYPNPVKQEILFHCQEYLSCCRLLLIFGLVFDFSGIEDILRKLLRKNGCWFNYSCSKSFMETELFESLAETIFMKCLFVSMSLIAIFLLCITGWKIRCDNSFQQTV